MARSGSARRTKSARGQPPPPVPSSPRVLQTALTSRNYGNWAELPRANLHDAMKEAEEYHHTEKVNHKTDVLDEIVPSHVVAPYDTYLDDMTQSNVPVLPEVHKLPTPRANIHLGRKNATSEENGLIHGYPDLPSPRRSPRRPREKRPDANPHAKVLQPYDPNAARNRLPADGGNAPQGPGKRHNMMKPGVNPITKGSHEGSHGTTYRNMFPDHARKQKQQRTIKSVIDMGSSSPRY